MENSNERPYVFNLNKTINSLVLVVSMGILAHLIFLLITNDQNIFQYLSRIKLPYLLLIILCLLCNWFGHALRLVIWTRYLGQQFRFLDALRIAIYTELGAAVTPTIIGGGPIKLALMIKNKLSTGKAGFLTLLNGLEDFIMYSTVMLIGFFHARDSIFRILASIFSGLKSNFISILGSVLFLYVLHKILMRFPFFRDMHYIPGKYRQAWNRMMLELKSGWHEMLASFNKVRKDGLRYLLVSLVVLFTQWTIRFSVLIILLTALDIDFKPFQVYIQQWIVYLTMVFIPTPGASGGAEATFFLLFEKQLPKDLLPLIISTWRFFMYYLMLFLAVSLVQFIRFPGQPESSTDNNSSSTNTQ